MMNVQKLKTLVVDDNLAFLESMKKTLESKNCEVVCLTDAHKALHHLISEHYHVVFLDCVLKDESGMQLGSRIRDILGDSVQIVMMSGIVSSKSLSSYIDLGFNFLSKPISDSEIEIIIRTMKEKYAFYGKYNNILIKLFQKNTSSVETLRFFSSLKKARHYEFFLYVGAALSSRESLKLTFTLNNRTQKIFLDEGDFIDYKFGNPKVYIEKLLSNNLIEPETAFKLKNKTEDECTEYLISSLSVSPDQILNVKYDRIIETFKSIHPAMEVSLNFQMAPKKEPSYSILSQSEYADIILLLLKQKFNSQMFSLFDKNLMERNFIFNTKLKKNDYLPELTSIIKELKSEIKLEALYKTYIKDKNTFCFYIFYILLKGGVFISSKKEDQSSYEYLYERYHNLEKFIKQTAKKDVFQIISGLYGQPLNAQKKKKIYINFVKYNHLDKMSGYNLSKEIREQINKTLVAFRNVYEEETNVTVKKNLQEKEKREILKGKMLLNEKQKKAEHCLMQGDYESVHSILQTVPKSKVDADLEWQMLFVWFDLKSKKPLDIKKQIFLSWQASIQKNKKKLVEHKLYYYIVGLNYIKRGEYNKALESFKVSKQLDYSFKPNYEEIQNCTLLLLKQKRNSSHFLRKLMKFKSQANVKKKTS